MIKIKDFTLASKNLGGGGKVKPPCSTHLPPMLRERIHESAFKCRLSFKNCGLQFNSATCEYMYSAVRALVMAADWLSRALIKRTVEYCLAKGWEIIYVLYYELIEEKRREKWEKKSKKQQRMSIMVWSWRSNEICGLFIYCTRIILYCICIAYADTCRCIGRTE